MNGSPEFRPKPASVRRDAERRTDHRVLVPALLLSLLVHVVLLFMVGFDAEPADVEPHGPAQVPRRADAVMRAYDIAAVATEPAAIEAQLQQRRVMREVDAQPQAWSPGPGATDDAAPRTGTGGPVQDRLRYRMGSAEVWRPQAPLAVEEPTPDDVVRARVAARLQEYNDSVAAAGAAAARATDWTVKDGNGGRWGVSPGSLHLGGVTVPLPFALSTPPGRREEAAGRIRSWTEIQEQASRAEGRQIVDERVRAMRERADQERSAGSPANPPPPDPGGG